MNHQGNFHTEEILQQFENQKSKHLGYSLILDFLGMATFSLPLLGEGLDIIYGPIYGIAIYSIYRVRLGKMRSIAGGILGTIEEVLPFTDFIPTATLMWIYTYKIRRQATLRTFTRNYRDDRDIIEREFFHEPVRRRSSFARMIDWGNSIFSGGNSRAGTQPKHQIEYDSQPHYDDMLDLNERE